MDHLTDEELVTLCLQGKQEAYGIIVARYQKQVFSLAFSLGKDYDEARDLAQEAFLRIYRELGRFDNSRKFFPWMYRVAHNTCINALHKKPQDIVSLDVMIEQAPIEAPAGTTPEAVYEKEEVSQLVQEAISSLPENYRLPVMLKYLEGLSYQEIALRLDLPVSTIETRLFRGRQMLQKKLAHVLGKELVK